MPSPYLFLVNSRPTKCDEETWEKWYIEDHIPQTIEHNVATRAALYREVYDIPSLYTQNKEKVYPRKYLAIYQTEFKELLKSEDDKKVTTKSDIFPGSKDIFDNGEFDARNYELLHDFDPNNLGDTPGPYILYAELEYDDAEDLDVFYRSEHFPLLAKVPGYRRGLRYEIGPTTPMAIETPARFLALHEFDRKHGIEGTPEMDAVTTTPWTQKVMSNVKFSVIRSFELVKTFGY